jgi:hypothetical protein
MKSDCSRKNQKPMTMIFETIYKKGIDSYMCYVNVSLTISRFLFDVKYQWTKCTSQENTTVRNIKFVYLKILAHKLIL